jgi:Ca2+-binding RTX toxin-like protein
MELLVLLSLGLAIGLGVAIFDDDNDDDNSSATTEEPDLEPTEDHDVLIGSEGDDTVFAGAGDDLIEGRGGDDRSFGQEGNDCVTGGTGDDFMRGGSGNDAILDHEGADTIWGDLGDDTIVATSALDGEEIGQLARDVADELAAGGDPDVTPEDLQALSHADEDDTDDDADSIHAGYGNDIVIAGDGDTVTLGEGDDTLALGDWMAPDDDPVILTDFTQGEDMIIYSHDGEGAMPELAVTRIDDGSTGGTALVFADNALIARVPGAGNSLTVSDISIVDRTEAPLVTL